ncbi:hypothetical protein [Endozoicomonas sp. ALE010]|uniref:hypothetical protein n=1 Tax=Endozoicomonas sp. ALE010 TaxID=3403081 RepID=UPI003BB53D92
MVGTIFNRLKSKCYQGVVKVGFKHQRKRMQDAEKRKMINQRKRERYREMMKDPEKRELTKQRQRNECKTPKKEN